MAARLVDNPIHRGAVRCWLLIMAGLIFWMVVVGGATRLTESGLSIVEWRPLTGTVPPLGDVQWQDEFEKYQAIPQYRLVNRGMSLAEFKTIYWWEWAHRLLGRLIGVVFLLPLLWFLWRGWIEKSLRARLWLIFGLGAFQGAVGWWMVASGLAQRTEVSQYRLAAHLVLACLIFAATLWTAQGLASRRTIAAPMRSRATALALVVLVLVQLYLGALLAGLRGGLVYNTWPLIDGAFVPPVAELFAVAPLWRNLFENILTVQFFHRMTTYVLLVVAIWHAVDVARSTARPALSGTLALAAGITLQASLGILTLVNQAPLPLALAHQAMAVLVLALAVIHGERLSHGTDATADRCAPATLPSSPRA